MKIEQCESKLEDSFEFKSSGDESEDENQNVENKDEKEKSKFSDFSQIANLPTTNALSISKEKYPLELVKSNRKKIENNSNNEKLRIKNEEKRVLKTIFMMDIICILSDLFCVTILYFDHFSHIRRNFQFSSTSIRIRFFCLALSLIVVLLLTLRKKLILKKDQIRETKASVKVTVDFPFASILDTHFLLNLIFHMLQPYPYLNFYWKMKIIGIDVTYSLDMILFILSIFRFSSFITIISFWYIFTSERSARIFNHFNGKNIKKGLDWGFSFKVTTKYFNLLSLIPIFMIVIYLYGLVFKVVEDFDPEGVYTRFNNITNCLWFILVTMTTIGYGDFTPATMIGRIIIVTCCIVGVFMISLIFSSFVVLTDLENSELEAYNQIEYFYLKDKNKAEYESYLNDFISYKINKLRRNSSSGLDALVEKYKLEIKKKRIMQQIKNKKGSEKKVLEIFSNAITKSWEKVDEYLINFSNISPRLLSNCDVFNDKGPSLRDELKSSQKLSFRIFNLAKFFNRCGGLLEITDGNLLNSKTMIQTEKLDKAILSFTKVYNHRKSKCVHMKEKEKSDRLDTFFNLDYVIKLQNRSPEKPSYDSSTNSQNEIKVKSSIIANKSITFENFYDSSTNKDNLENIETLDALKVIDEELSDWDN